MQLTPATLFRLWQRADAMQDYARPARAILRHPLDPIRGYNPALGMEEKPSYRLIDAAAVAVKQAEAWQRITNNYSKQATEAVSDAAYRLLEMTRNPHKFTRTELLANRHVTGLSIYQCERDGCVERVVA